MQGEPLNMGFGSDWATLRPPVTATVNPCLRVFLLNGPYWSR